MKVLIAGAGPAGLSLAFWLHHYGIEAVVLERAPAVRTGGYMIDFFGTGYDIAERMNILSDLATRHVPVEEMQFVDTHGKRLSGMSIKQMKELLEGRLYNFPRGDLVDVLYQHVRDKVELRTDTHITQLDNLEGDGPVQVTLSHGNTEEYDIVVGADGIHSSLRKLVFCPHSEVEVYLGYQCGSFRVPRIHDETPAFYSYSEPGILMSYYPLQEDETAIFYMYEADEPTRPPRRELKSFLLDKFAPVGWRTQEILAMIQDDTDIYHDTVTQVKLDTWHKGKAVLLGDSAFCMTLLSGQGASFAMGGAYLLAYELQQHNQDPTAAFANYQGYLFNEIRRRQEAAQGTGKWFCPGSRFGIFLRNLFTQIMFWPGIRHFSKQQIGAQSAIPEHITERV